MKQRFWEIDALRGTAIVMMVIYHFVWSLYFFGFVRFETLISPFWKYFQRTIACSFITLVGVSLVISHLAGLRASSQNQRAKRSRKREPPNVPWWRQVIPYGWVLIVLSALLVLFMATNPSAKVQRVTAAAYLALLGVTWGLDWFSNVKQRRHTGFSKSLWRGLWIFGWGIVISASVAIGGTGSVDFGVLHLIGFSIVASHPLLTFRWLNVALWLLFNIGGYYLLPARADDLWWVWLGWRPERYGAVDYFPIVPWFGVVLLGIAIGNFAYGADGRNFRLPDFSAWFPPNLLQWLGQRSLFIYLIHQPIIFAILSGLIGLGLI